MTESSTPVRRHRLLTEAEVADLLRVSGRTVRRWADRGAIVAVQIGGIRRYPAHAIDALVGDLAPSTNDKAPAGNGRQVTTTPAGVGDGHGP